MSQVFSPADSCVCWGVIPRIETDPIRVLSIADHRLTHWYDLSMICEMGRIDYYSGCQNYVPISCHCAERSDEAIPLVGDKTASLLPASQRLHQIAEKDAAPGEASRCDL